MENIYPDAFCSSYFGGVRCWDVKKLIKGRTFFVFAHRLSTIRDCDKILVISDGEIIEAGTHDELLRNKGMYYDLYSAQYEFLNEGA